MNRKLLVTLAILLFFKAHLCACSCGPYELVFCNAVAPENHIVLAVVSDTLEYHNMEVTIVENIRHFVGTNTIRILGQDGLSCGEGLEVFELGDTIVLALDSSMFKDAIHQEYYTWYLDGCGRRFLNYENGIVRGRVKGDLEDLDYEEFKNGIDDCIFTVGISESKVLPDHRISIYPNPSTSHFFVDMNLGHDDTYEFDVTDIGGQIILSGLELSQGENQIEAKDVLGSGVYFLIARSKNNIIVEKFIRL